MPFDLLLDEGMGIKLQMYKKNSRERFDIKYKFCDPEANDAVSQ
jgi:hypothetical protein